MVVLVIQEWLVVIPSTLHHIYFVAYLTTLILSVHQQLASGGIREAGDVAHPVVHKCSFLLCILSR
jgi:hypothetical protein